MSVDIEPFELSFRRPFTSEVAQTLTIKNPSSTPVAFKVKTTAPKQYCVRPNAGRIEAGQSFDVAVLLQAMKQDPPPDARCRDKFLVQSAPITAEKEFASIANVLETTEKSQLVERKIRVNWLAANPELDESANRPVATPNKQAIANGATDTPDISRTYSSPVAKEESPSAAAPPPYQSEHVPEEDEKPQAAEDPEPKSTVAQATAAVKEAAEVSYEELKAKLAQAEAQIVSLRETGLRQRNVKPASSEDEKRPMLQTAQAVQQTVEGVPVQMAAILCLISFLLAYFFF
ncbi:MSP domain-containing protein [Fusarium keratoplasticum]|uniref:MSP domain-containing protein n=1 Tax=Fusarium keratoplasticum TaxID=1328300 RepID=A0ACC0QXC5_9HYPO|nr:MSP domain-containing protein [Fusarium keratoplasticum]KAI8669525.1 MSP domain-containing protein [Fusarium keratoplasticum]